MQNPSFVMESGGDRNGMPDASGQPPKRKSSALAIAPAVQLSPAEN